MYTYSKLGTNGALGNQLWQIAGTIGRALDNEDGFCFPKWAYSKYFSIPEIYFVDDPEGTDLAPDFLQEIRHWWAVGHQIQRYLSPSELTKSLAQERGLPTEAIGVHVRRANNLQLPDHHPVCGIEYYEQAVEILGGGPLVVFSDDIEWCRQQDLFRDATFAPGPPSNVNLYDLTGPQPLATEEAVLDLFCMAACSNHVISNSSFSWWAAYLGGPSDVVYPDPWYGPAYDHLDVKGMFPIWWTRLEREI